MTNPPIEAASCNLCGRKQFKAYRGRPNEVCATCGAKARHRVAWHVYQNLLSPLAARAGGARVLHLAPEKALHAKLSAMFGAGYLTADPAPERYPYARCLRLFFPNDYAIFPDELFDVILHNHVLEHIPGHYGDHLRAFTRLLAPRGIMIFSIPGPYLDRPTQEGGEHLASDAERLERFLQEDHFKLIGSDFPDVLASLEGGNILPDGITDEIRSSLAVRPGKAPFFVWQKD